ncbi:hypothetical protein B0H17DRAFT_1132653 [Mycena rosella]|uniref:Uncharacterized protein n=1 Tax=Mycena rosella TaxID=1033263 RepID=A0AAD7GG82_MYCRO|nr:hypothetical protein B0H17DRAFT_1132653 [Mycena rosella]
MSGMDLPSTAQKPCLFYTCCSTASGARRISRRPKVTDHHHLPRSNTLVFGARTREETETPERKAGNTLVSRVSCFGEDPNQRMHWCESEHEAKYDGICGAFAEVKTRTNGNAGASPRVATDSGGVNGEQWPCPKGQGPSPKYGRVGRVICAWGCRHGMGETRGHTQSVYSPHNIILFNEKDLLFGSGLRWSQVELTNHPAVVDTVQHPGLKLSIQTARYGWFQAPDAAKEIFWKEWRWWMAALQKCRRAVM